MTLLEVLMLWSSLFYLMKLMGRKGFLKMSCFKERNIIYTSSNITRASWRE